MLAGLPDAGWNVGIAARERRRPAADSCAWSGTASHAETYNHLHRPDPTHSDPG